MRTANPVAEQDQIARIVGFAQALSDPLRVRILALLLAGRGSCCAADPAKPVEGICVCEIMEHLGLIQSKVSYHLARLKEVGLIKEAACGKWNYYSVDRQVAVDLLDTFSRFLIGHREANK